MALLTNINGKLTVDSTGSVSFNRIGTSTTTGFTFPALDGSANQILKTNGSGILSWVDDEDNDVVTKIIGGTNITVSPATGIGDVTVNADLAGTVTGSGTLNKVARWTATGSDIGDGPITFSAATATATSTFGGGVALTDGVLESFNAQPMYFYSTTTALNYELLSIDKPASGNARLRVYKSGSGSYRGLEFHTNGSTSLTIDTSQNVTVGGADVNAGRSVKITNSSTGVAADSRLQLVSDTVTFDIIASSSTYTNVASWVDAGILSTDANASGGLIFNAQAGGIKLQTGTTERMTIDATGLTYFAGQVAIGDPTPNSGGKLDIVGGFIANGYNSNGRSTFDGSTDQNLTITVNQSQAAIDSYIFFKGSNGGAAPTTYASMSEDNFKIASASFSIGTATREAKTQTQLTVAVGTSATIILTTISDGMSSAAVSKVTVYGENNGGKGFYDEVLVCANNSLAPQVITALNTSGTADSRTYTVVSNQLKLAMGATGYNVNVKSEAMGYPF